MSADAAKPPLLSLEGQRGVLDPMMGMRQARLLRDNSQGQPESSSGEQSVLTALRPRSILQTRLVHASYNRSGPLSLHESRSPSWPPRCLSNETSQEMNASGEQVDKDPLRVPNNSARAV